VALPFVTHPVCLPILFRLWGGKGSASSVELAGRCLACSPTPSPAVAFTRSGCGLPRPAAAGRRGHHHHPATVQCRLVRSLQTCSRKLQQQMRGLAVSDAPIRGWLGVNNAQRRPLRHFASKGLGVRVPLAPPLVSGTFAARRRRPGYSSKVQQRCRRVVMLSSLRAARRAPSTLSKSSRWSLGCIHPSSPRSGCGAVSAWPPAGGHQGQRAKMRRPCGWHAPSS
jgi:hypothetical protein